MAILFNKTSGLITIHTKNTTYQMQADSHRYLLHLYYGKRMEGSAESLLYHMDRGHSANPEDAGSDRTYSLEQLPLEFPFRGGADFRTPAFRMKNSDGSYGCDLRFHSFEVRNGKYTIPGLPSSYAQKIKGKTNGVQTLEIVLFDAVSGVEVHLLYGVFEEEDVITRAVRVENHGDKMVTVQKAASCSLDFQYGDYETLTFYGRHEMERNVQRTKISHGSFSIGSLRGASSHFYNPFVILKEEGTNEDRGSAYGIHLVYSGNFRMEAEKSGYDQTRLVMGMNDETFSWRLEPGEVFHSPECIMAYSDFGLGWLSNLLHRFIRDHIVRGEWQYKRRPVLINNWEATGMNFNKDKLIKIAKSASELGVEMMVLDDGWFGKRDDDTSGLGDWKVNTEKLGGTLQELSQEIHTMGMKFGLWFEPEMISEDSDLFRAHPDWALRIPGRSFSRGRNQLVLDFSRQEIVDNIYKQMTAVLDSAEVDYIKWDMNRNLTDVFSRSLPPTRQGEIMHRYMLGVYNLLERLIARYPHILFEGCCGGGGRYDVGMLCYTPQIWCSDNTDAIDRCLIQYGTSFGYPPITMGAHVSAVPNEQTGRVTPFEARAVVAMAGTFGYELDLSLLSSEERAEVPSQIERFKKDYDVTHFGDYYRLSDPFGTAGLGSSGASYVGMSGNGAGAITAWMCVARDKSKAVVSAVFHDAHGNPTPHYVRLKGLDEDAHYYCEESGRHYAGSALMHAGIMLPVRGQYEAMQLHFTKYDGALPEQDAEELE